MDAKFSRGNGVTDPPLLQTLEAHRRTVESVVTALHPWLNWYLDLGNERNFPDKRFASFDDLESLRDLATQSYPTPRIGTQSGGVVEGRRGPMREPRTYGGFELIESERWHAAGH